MLFVLPTQLTQPVCWRTQGFINMLYIFLSESKYLRKDILRKDIRMFFHCILHGFGFKIVFMLGWLLQKRTILFCYLTHSWREKRWIQKALKPIWYCFITKFFFVFFFIHHEHFQQCSMR